MDRQDAIDLLDNLVGMVDDNHNSDYDTALKMGIQALQTEQLKESQEIFNKDSAPESMLNADLIDSRPAREVLNNSINLCDSCKYDFPECPSGKDDVLFGDGKGNDNICCCNKYQLAQKVIRCKDCDEWHRGKNHDGSDVYSDEGFCSVHRIITGENYHCGDAERR